MSEISVNTPCLEYEQMALDWVIVDALMGGTRAMRAAGEKLLPKFIFEESDDYQRRLGASVLFPAYSETIKAMAGRVFRKPVSLGEGTPASIQALTKAITPSQDNIGVLSAEWLVDALSYGISHVLVDFPNNPGAVNKADEKALNLRPFAMVIRHDQVIGWRQERGELVQLRVREFVTEPDGDWGVKTIEQIRVFEPGGCQVYRRGPGENTFSMYGEPVLMTLGRIPLVTLYAKRLGFMMARPPLMDLAYLNVAHWQSASDQRNILHVARVPVLTISGCDNQTDIKIGSASAVKLPKDAVMQYVEHSGAAISAGADDLKALEDQLRQAGAKLLQPAQLSRITATQSAEDKARTLSPLAQIAQSLEDGLNNVLQLCAEWMNEPNGGRVEITADFDVDATPENSMATLVSMQQAGILSKETVFSEAKRRNLVSEDCDWGDEQNRIADDGVPLGTAGENG